MLYFCNKVTILHFGIAIKKIISLLLLLLVLLSSLPRQLLHDQFATHKDEIEICTHKNQSSCIHHQTFKCHFEKFFVANDAYTPEIIEFVNFTHYYPAAYYSIDRSPLSVIVLLSGNKGPPVFS